MQSRMAKQELETAWIRGQEIRLDILQDIAVARVGMVLVGSRRNFAKKHQLQPCQIHAFLLQVGISVAIHGWSLAQWTSSSDPGSDWRPLITHNYVRWRQSKATC